MSPTTPTHSATTRSTGRDFIERVREATDIAEIIGQDVELHPAGSVRKGLSPFCQEKTPSFVVWPNTGTWHDFSNGGGRGGDVFAYLMERDGIDFRGALVAVAHRYGMRLPNESDDEFRQHLAREDERRDIERVLTLAAAHYHSALPPEIRDQYYRQRYGFTDATIDQLQLGSATGDLLQHLTGKHQVSRELALKTGLFVVRPGGKVADFFVRRLMFPYWRRGRVAYFIGRRTHLTQDAPWEQAKYKKLRTRSDKAPYISETIANDTFFNEDAARGAGMLVITEGITDCISARQAGFACISPGTTSFRQADASQLAQLARRAKRVVICNDNETGGAGTAGALKTAKTLTDHGIDVRIARLPRPSDQEKVDLNDFLRTNTATALGALLDEALPWVDYLIESIPKGVAPADVGGFVNPILQAAARLSPIAQPMYVEKLAGRVGVPRSAVAKALKQLRQAPEAKRTQTPDDDRLLPAKGEVLERRDHYCVRTAKGGLLRISSFRIVPRQRVQFGGGFAIVGDVVTMRGTEHKEMRFDAAAFQSKRGFVQALQAPDMQWTGTDDNVQSLLGVLDGHDVPTRTGAEVLGYVETPSGPRWVTPDHIFDAEGVMTEPDVVLRARDPAFARMVDYPIAAPAQARQIAARILPDLLAVNEPCVALPLIGWFFAAPFKPRLVGIIHHFPILWVWGTRGSGKTSMVNEVFLRFSGLSRARGTATFSVTQTRFALISLLSSTTSIPVFLDEYRPDDMRSQQAQDVHRLLRSSYGGETDRRGSADLSVAEYRLSAPVVVGGEARPDDAALLDRLVSVTPDPNTLVAREEYRAAFRRLTESELEQLAAPLAQFALGRDPREDFRDAVARTDAALESMPHGDQLSPRCRDNLRVVTFGLLMFEAFATQMGVRNLPPYDLADALSSTIADLMQGERGAKSPLDLFVEECATMAYTGDLEEGVNWALINGDVVLHLPSCWQAYAERQARIRQGTSSTAAQLLAIHRMARESERRGGYVRDVGSAVRLRSARVRCLRIARERAEFLDLDGFARGTDRNHGGRRGGHGGPPQDRGSAHTANDNTTE